MNARPGQTIYLATVVNVAPAAGTLRLRLVRIGVAGGNAYGPSNAGIMADTDNPLLFEATITLPADFAAGSYSIGWDVGGNPWFDYETLIVLGSDTVTTPGRPTVAQVAAILRARTRGISSRDASVAGEHGTFDTTTRPTYEQVEELITLAVSELTGMLGGRAPCTDQLMLSAATAVAYRAAMLVEVSFMPEQTTDDQTAFKALQAMWKDSAALIVKNIAEQCPLITDPGGVVSLSGMPTGRVPWRQATTWQEIH